MSRLDELPPDQRAALSLLLSKRKSYAEVSAMLGIPEQAVQDRAQAALTMLAPGLARPVPAERRREIGDYLLGQQPGVADRLRTRTYLGASEPARAWALALAGELSPLADGALADIPPAALTPATAPPDGAAQGLPAAGGASQGRETPVAASQAQDAPPGEGAPSSRLGGALLLAAIVVAIVVAVIAITSSSGGSSKKAATTASTATKTGPQVTAQLPLRPPNPASHSIGVVAVLSEKGKRAFYIEAQNLPPTHNFYYAIWLYNSPTSALALSRSPPVGSDRRLGGGAPLPVTASQYHEMLLTRETLARPTRPGHVVLSGPFTVGA